MNRLFDICLNVKYLDFKIYFREDERTKAGIADGRKWCSRFPVVVEGGACTSEQREEEGTEIGKEEMLCRR
jgi:hypothetical protein